MPLTSALVRSSAVFSWKQGAKRKMLHPPKNDLARVAFFEMSNCRVRLILSPSVRLRRATLPGLATQGAATVDNRSRAEDRGEKEQRQEEFGGRILRVGWDV